MIQAPDVNFNTSEEYVEAIPCNDLHLTADQVQTSEGIIFWVQSVVGSVLAAAGLVINCFSTYILCWSKSRHLNTLFNKLLTCLIIAHTLHIFLAQVVHWSHEFNQLWVQRTFAYFLYPAR